MKEAELPEPIFEFTEFFSVTFRRIKTDETVEKTREKIVQLISENPTITIEEMAVIIDITSKGVEYNIDKLKKEGILKRVGPAKGGHWVVTSEK